MFCVVMGGVVLGLAELFWGIVDPVVDALAGRADMVLARINRTYRCEKCGHEFVGLTASRICVRCGTEWSNWDRKKE